MPSSKARRTTARAVSKGSTLPKLCQRPREMAGSLRPLRPQLRYVIVSYDGWIVIGRLLRQAVEWRQIALEHHQRVVAEAREVGRARLSRVWHVEVLAAHRHSVPIAPRKDVGDAPAHRIALDGREQRRRPPGGVGNALVTGF